MYIEKLSRGRAQDEVALNVNLSSWTMKKKAKVVAALTGKSLSNVVVGSFHEFLAKDLETVKKLSELTWNLYEKEQKI